MQRFNRCFVQKAPNGYKWLLWVYGLYKCLSPAILSLLESQEVTPTPKNVSKPSKCLLIKSLVLSIPLRVLVLGLALERVWEQGVEFCVLVLEWTNLYPGAPAILGVFVTRRHIFDPPVWCAVVPTTLCRGRGDHHPSWISSLVENGAKVTRNLGKLWWHCLCDKSRCPWKRLSVQEAILLIECFNNVD